MIPADVPDDQAHLVLAVHQLSAATRIPPLLDLVQPGEIVFFETPAQDDLISKVLGNVLHLTQDGAHAGVLFDFGANPPPEGYDLQQGDLTDSTIQIFFARSNRSATNLWSALNPGLAQLRWLLDPQGLIRSGGFLTAAFDQNAAAELIAPYGVVRRVEFYVTEAVTSGWGVRFVLQQQGVPESLWEAANDISTDLVEGTLYMQQLALTAAWTTAPAQLIAFWVPPEGSGLTKPPSGTIAYSVYFEVVVLTVAPPRQFELQNYTRTSEIQAILRELIEVVQAGATDSADLRSALQTTSYATTGDDLPAGSRVVRIETLIQQGVTPPVVTAGGSTLFDFADAPDEDHVAEARQGAVEGSGTIAGTDDLLVVYTSAPVPLRPLTLERVADDGSVDLVAESARLSGLAAALVAVAASAVEALLGGLIPTSAQMAAADATLQTGIDDLDTRVSVLELLP